MLPDRISNPGPPTYESGALPIALRGPASPVLLLNKYSMVQQNLCKVYKCKYIGAPNKKGYTG